MLLLILSCFQENQTAKSESNLTSLSVTHTAPSSSLSLQGSPAPREEVEEGHGTSPAPVGGATLPEKEEESDKKKQAWQQQEEVC